MPHLPTVARARIGRIAIVAGTGALLSSAAAVHAGDAGSGRAAPNVVEGTVRTADGRGVPGATITISGAVGAGRTTVRTATTDARGNYRVAVPRGHYAVRAVADLEFEGQTYRELALDPVGTDCTTRRMSDAGITRHFVLRLSGVKRCYSGSSVNDPGAYHGGTVTAMSGRFPAEARVTFTFTPVGRLADGSAGKVLTFVRTGAALQRGGGRLGETADLHDIPLGRYGVTAEVRHPDGGREAVLLARSDMGDPPARRAEVSFPPNRMVPYGFRDVTLTLSAAGGAPAVVKDVPAVPDRRPPAPAGVPGLPVGRYACSYRSPYAGDIPTSAAIVVVDGTRYEAYGGSGTYAFDRASGTVRWTSGPLAASDVRATFERGDAGPAITVVGGPAADDPDRTNRCVRSGG